MARNYSLVFFLFTFWVTNLGASHTEQLELEEIELEPSENHPIFSKADAEDPQVSCYTRVLKRIKNLASSCLKKLPVPSAVIAKSTIDAYLILKSVDEIFLTNNLKDAIVTSSCARNDACHPDFIHLNGVADYVYDGYIFTACFGVIAVIFDLVTFERYLRSNHPNHAHSILAAALSNASNYMVLMASSVEFRNLCYGQRKFIASMEPHITDALSKSIDKADLPIMVSATAAGLGTLGICYALQKQYKCLKLDCLISNSRSENQGTRVFH